MKLIYSLGLVVALIPFLGIPDSWKTTLFFVIGITIFTKAYLIHRISSKAKENGNNSSFKQNFLLVENNLNNQDFNEIRSENTD